MYETMNIANGDFRQVLEAASVKESHNHFSMRGAGSEPEILEVTLRNAELESRHSMQRAYCPQQSQRAKQTNKGRVMRDKIMFWKWSFIRKNFLESLTVIKNLTLQKSNGVVCMDRANNQLNNILQIKEQVPGRFILRNKMSND